MPFVINYQDGIFEIEVFGKPNFKTFDVMAESLFAHDKWTPGSPILFDYTNLDTSSTSQQDIYQIVDSTISCKDKYGHCKFASLTSRGLEFGMVRMWESLVDGKWDGKHAPFKSKKEAITWLKDKST